MHRRSNEMKYVVSRHTFSINMFATCQVRQLTAFPHCVFVENAIFLGDGDHVRCSASSLLQWRLSNYPGHRGQSGVIRGDVSTATRCKPGFVVGVLVIRDIFIMGSSAALSGRADKSPDSVIPFVMGSRSDGQLLSFP